MKKKLKKGEVHAIKIDEAALYEFIRESMNEKCLEYFDLYDSKCTEQCMYWDKDSNSFTCIVYNQKDRAKVDFDSINASLAFTTTTLFKKSRYTTLQLTMDNPSCE